MPESCLVVRTGWYKIHPVVFVGSLGGRMSYLRCPTVVVTLLYSPIGTPSFFLFLITSALLLVDTVFLYPREDVL